MIKVFSEKAATICKTLYITGLDACFDIAHKMEAV